MRETSKIAEIIARLERSSKDNLGCVFHWYESLELLGHIKNYEEAYGLQEAELARLRALNARLIEDAERLAVTLSDEECCRPHGKWLDLHADHDEHSSDCPLVLHRQLMAEINGEPNCTMEEK